MKPNFRIISLCIALIMIFSGVTVFGAAKKEEPELGSASAELYCENTGETVFKQKDKEKFSPYGTVQLMTAILAVQRMPLDKEITVSSKAVSQPGPKVNLVEVEKVTVETLLNGMLLTGANDCAYALAEGYSGDVDEFVKNMNEIAKNMGCKDTQFASPGGTVNDIKKEHTTAKDLTEIMRSALDDKNLSAIMSSDKYKAPADNLYSEWEIKRGESLLDNPDLGIKAIKASVDNPSGSVLAAYSKKSGLKNVIVLFAKDSATADQDVETLINYAYKKVDGVKVVKAGENVGKVRIKHGAMTKISGFAQENGYAYLPKEGSKSLVESRFSAKSDVEAPVKKGDVIGKFDIYVAGDKVNSINVVSKVDVPVGWFPSYIGISNRTTVIICVIAGLFVLLLIVRAVNKAKMRRRKKARRKQMIMEMARKQVEEERKRGFRR